MSLFPLKRSKCENNSQDNSLKLKRDSRQYKESKAASELVNHPAWSDLITPFFSEYTDPHIYNVTGLDAAFAVANHSAKSNLANLFIEYVQRRAREFEFVEVLD